LELAEFSELQVLARQFDEMADKILTRPGRQPRTARLRQKFGRAISSRPYAMYKILRELLAQNAQARDGNVCVLRCSNIFGPADDGVTTALANQALMRQPLSVTSPDAVRTFVHILDVTSAIAAAIAADCRGAINITNPANHISIGDLASRIISLCKSPPPIEWGQAAGEIHPPYSIEMAQTTLGFTPQIGLKEGLIHLLTPAG
jgi:nucleoside-diphosphate-sugar epimerase